MSRVGSANGTPRTKPRTKEPLELVSALVANSAEPASTAEDQPIGNGVPNYAWVLNTNLSYKPLQREEKIWRGLADNGEVFVRGRSGSGKTTLARTLAQRWLDTPDLGGLVWLNLVDPNDGAESIVLTLLTTPRRPRYLVVVDNTQANPTKAKRIFKLVGWLRAELGLAISVLATGWLDPSEIGLPGTVGRFDTEPNWVLRRLIADEQADGVDTDGIRRLANERLDLVIYAIRYYKSHGRHLPGRPEFLAWVAGEIGLDDVDDRECRRGLYLIACLTMFEIDLPVTKAKRELGSENLAHLVERGLVVPMDTSYQARSRAMASVIAHHALAHWDGPDDPLQRPAEIAANYLTYAGEGQIKATLGKIDLINKVGGFGSPETRFLGHALKHRQRIANLLRRQVESDAKWGDNMASAAFACIALAQLDMPDPWNASASAIRNRWTYPDDGTLPTYGDHPTAEIVDFERMHAEMRAADNDGAREQWPNLNADTLDVGRVHRTWMLGMLLGFEGTAPKPDRDSLERLYRCAESAQETNGAFYPERVPWVTARVLIGLCEAGFAGSDVARLAAEWIRDTGASDVGWGSGTGNWNTDHMSTALCLIALSTYAEFGDDLTMQAGYAILQSPPTDSAEAPSPVSRALFAQAALLGDRRGWPEEAFYEIRELLELVSKDETWQLMRSSVSIGSLPTTPPEYTESTDVPFLAEVLGDCVWRTARTELRPLLRDLERLVLHR